MTALLSILLSSCSNDAKTDSPDKVIRIWQQYMDKNDIQNAKQYSSLRTQQWLEKIGTAFGEGASNAETTTFSNITCEEKDNKATCICNIKVSGAAENYQDVFYLIKENGKWVVDLSEAENSEFEPPMVEEDSNSVIKNEIKGKN